MADLEQRIAELELMVELLANAVTGVEDHQARYLLARGYAAGEIQQERQWFRSLGGGDADRLTRHHILQDYLRTFPQRTEQELVELSGARWQDGYRGLVTALVLEREPE